MLACAILATIMLSMLLFSYLTDLYYEVAHCKMTVGDTLIYLVFLITPLVFAIITIWIFYCKMSGIMS